MSETQAALYEPRSDDFLKQLAKDIWAGKVFCTWHIGRDEMQTALPQVFLPLALMTAEMGTRLKAAEITFLYEYVAEAGPSGVNGLPCFLSMKELSRDDERRLEAVFERVRAAMEGV